VIVNCNKQNEQNNLTTNHWSKN